MLNNYGGGALLACILNEEAAVVHSEHDGACEQQGRRTGRCSFVDISVPLAGYAPNMTLDVTVGGVSQVLFGNAGGPNFEQANYPQVCLSW